MKNLHYPQVNDLRDVSQRVLRLYGNVGDETCGCFNVPSPIDGAMMYVVASSGEDWDHVSVSRKNRCPNWPEMDHIKRLFFNPSEVCMQLHVADSDHLSVHDYCLHIWRPNNGQTIPLPPKFMVA